MGNQYSSLKNETVIFIIPHTINTITIHVFKINPQLFLTMSKTHSTVTEYP